MAVEAGFQAGLGNAPLPATALTWLILWKIGEKERNAARTDKESLSVLQNEDEYKKHEHDPTAILLMLLETAGHILVSEIEARSAFGTNASDETHAPTRQPQRLTVGCLAGLLPADNLMSDVNPLQLL